MRRKEQRRRSSRKKTNKVAGGWEGGWGEGERESGRLAKWVSETIAQTVLGQGWCNAAPCSPLPAGGGVVQFLFVCDERRPSVHVVVVVVQPRTSPNEHSAERAGGGEGRGQTTRRLQKTQGAAARTGRLTQRLVKDDGAGKEDNKAAWLSGVCRVHEDVLRVGFASNGACCGATTT